MPAAQTFKAFFSYAHHDAAASPALVEALTTALSLAVNAKLINARFMIWRDDRNLALGERWDPTIEQELRGSDLLVVCLTPRWIDSDICRKEYRIFEEVEASYGGGSYVAPILVREVEPQRRHLNADQEVVYASLMDRQYYSSLVGTFFAMSEDERVLALEEIANGISGIIERRRRSSAIPPKQAGVAAARRRTPLNPEFGSSAHDFNRVGLLSRAEVEVERGRGDGERGVFAQADFVECLYVEGQCGRVEFGPRRAFVTVENHGPGSLSKVDRLGRPGERPNAYFVQLNEKPQAIAVCTDPARGRTVLAELALPPAEGENRLCRIATATGDVDVAKLKAEVRVALDAEGLHLADAYQANVSQAKRSQIKAVIQQAALKHHSVNSDGEICLPIEPRERER